MSQPRPNFLSFHPDVTETTFKFVFVQLKFNVFDQIVLILSALKLPSKRDKLVQIDEMCLAFFAFRLPLFSLVILWGLGLMSRKGPKVGQGMLDFVEDLSKGVDSH